MGFIRGFLIVILSVLLIVSFLIMNISLTFNLSLQYDNVKTKVGGVVENSISEDLDLEKDFDTRFLAMQNHCKNKNESEYYFDQGEYNFTISCNSVSQGIDSVYEEGAEQIIETLYYKDYECNFWKCFKEEGNPFFLVSEKTKNYWKDKFILALTVSLILIAAILLLAEKKHNAFFISGSLLILSSLPFIKLGAFLSSVDSVVLVFFNIFFSKSQEVFVIALISGIILIVIGILMKVFTIGFKVSKWFEKIKGNKVENPIQKPVESSKNEIPKKDKKSLVKKK